MPDIDGVWIGEDHEGYEPPDMQIDDLPCTCIAIECTEIACKGQCGCERCRQDYQDYGHDDE